jgi:hypothetical protein
MKSPAAAAKEDWLGWDLADWNRAWFRHLFLRDHADDAPVTRIATNADALRKVVSSQNAAPRDIRQAFKRTIVERLRLTGQSLCTDALRSEWDVSGEQECPPYVAHLVVTCLVASGAGEVSNNNDFRKHLNRFLSRDSNSSRYSLGDLPRLWEMLSTWLDKEVDSGRPHRRLVLPKPHPRLRIIGRSLGLAFPSHRDQKTLVAILHDAGFTMHSPAVLPVLQCVEKHLTRFTERFAHAFREFRSEFLSGNDELFTFPFWSSVKDAIASSTFTEFTTPQEQPIRARLRVDRGEDWGVCISICCDRTSSRALPPSLAIVHGDGLGLADFPYILQRTAGHDLVPSAAGLLIAGNLDSTLGFVLDKGL